MCSDGLVCNGVEKCQAGACRPGVVPGCDDGIACTADNCDENAGGCVHTPSDAACDNDAVCDGAERCDPAVGCQPGTPVVCADDGIACTVARCDETVRGCVHEPDDGRCADGDLCTIDTCDVAAGCAYGPSGICKPKTLVLGSVADTYIRAGNETSWDHGAAATLHVDRSPEALAYLRFDLGAVTSPVLRATLRLFCEDSGTEGGTVYPVADSTWIEGTGNGSASGANGPGLAFDEVDTNGNDSIGSGDTSPYVPDFTRPLAAFGQVRAAEYYEVDVTAAFQDGAGVYTLAIGDGGSNGAAYAARESGVASRRPVLRLDLGIGPECATDADCNDGRFCTGGEACVTGRCEAGTAVVCDDAVACTIDFCDEATDACATAARPNGTACDDGNVCTQTDACIAGRCIGGEPVICAALDQCHDPGACDPATGTCTTPAKPDGAPCDDSDLCTLADTCQAGTCVGANPMVCAAQDQCHEAGVCDPATGVCSDPVRPDGAACEDGSLCTQADACLAGRCVGAEPVVCTALDQCHAAGICNAATGLCSNPLKPSGTACADGNLCTQTDTCQAGACVGSHPLSCAATDQCHGAGVCEPATGMCSNPAKPNGTVCSDGNLCTQVDRCVAGTCVGMDRVVCAALDQCHLAGVCNPTTGVCSSAEKPAGTLCSDGDFCTRMDMCEAGACVGGDPATCAASDQCHTPGACDPATGACSDPAVADGSPCDDGTLCTRTDVCLGGTCSGHDSVMCEALDQCHAAGACNPVTGMCSTPAVTDGAGCDDGDLCTQVDSCRAGVCVGAPPVACAARDRCHVAGACDPATGACSEPVVTDGTGCDDDDLCTRVDSCRAGVCVAAAPVGCRARDQCQEEGVCDAATGMCTDPMVTDGAGCDDGDLCTQVDSCRAGVCVGAVPVACTARDQCHVAGACDAATGMCTDPMATDGAACADGDLCTRVDSCQAGRCVGAAPVACTARDQCHIVGVCDAATGMCADPMATDGTGCDDGDLCTVGDRCAAGTCVAGAPIMCAARDRCHAAGVCDPATGLCSEPGVADGAGCGDGDLCTVGDRCVAGTCVAGAPLMCVARDQCHAAGVCDPGTGACSEPVVADGTACDDGDLCTVGDRCAAGTCVAGAPVMCAASDQCQVASVCDPATGMCSTTAVADGAGCDDGDLCTVGDRCAAGTCVAGAPIMCAARDQCHAAGVCDPATGMCSTLVVADGSACDDGDRCTRVDTCQAGVCVGANSVVCTARDQCHAAGACDPATGACSSPAATDGTACDDGAPCTTGDTCQAGLCVTGAPVVCAPLDQCHGSGECNPVTGSCTHPTKADGTGCDDGDPCTRRDTCQAGVCARGEVVTCAAPDSCHEDGVCDPATGSCSNAAKPDGTACDDGAFCTVDDTCQAGVCQGTARDCSGSGGACADAVCDEAATACVARPYPNDTACDDGDRCTRSDRCQAGVCVGSDPVTCTPADQCHETGVCAPATGVCSSVTKPDGAACDDGDVCSADDVCFGGVCLGESLVDDDGDGFCDAVDVCPLVSDPEQADADGDGIGDLCQCTAPAPGRCIAGGGSRRTDCFMEFMSVGPVTLNNRGTTVKPQLRCRDGDPACDLDGARDGQCTFGVSVCFGNADPRLPACMPDMVDGVEVLQPRVAGAGVVNGYANAQVLEGALGDLGLEVRRRRQVIVDPVAPVGDNLCSPLIRVQTPSPATAGGKAVQQAFVFRATALSGRADKDRFVTICE